jgi:poly(A) polymerase
VRAELLKLLTAPGAAPAVHIMAESGLLTELLGIAPRPGVFERVAARDRSNNAAPDAGLRLSALTLAVVDDIPRIASRLKLSNAERDALLVVDAPLLEAFHGLDEARARRWLYRTGPERWRRMVLATAALTRPDHAAVPWSDLETLPVRRPPPKLPVGGADVVAAGLPPGPAVGRLLADLEDWWVEQDFPGEAAVRDRLAALAAAPRSAP